MTRPGAPTKVTPAIASEIDAMSARRLPLRAIARALAAQGHQVSVSTIRRYLARRDGDCSFLAAPEAAPHGAPDQLEQPAAALETDDLAALTRTCTEVEAAMRQYAEDLGRNTASQRAYASLTRLQFDLRGRLVALRPAPEVEHDRLSALGGAARAALLERARARAEVDWRARAERAMRLAGVEP